MQDTPQTEDHCVPWTAQGESAPTRRRAVSYLRVATLSQNHAELGEPGALAVQREACREIASRLGTEIVGEFVDHGSGTAVAHRLGLRRLLSRLDRGDIDDVIVHNLDRLTRNWADQWRLANQIQASGARLSSSDEQSAEVLYSLSFAAASLERSRVAKAAWARRTPTERRAIARRGWRTRRARGERRTPGGEQ